MILLPPRSYPIFDPFTLYILIRPLSFKCIFAYITRIVFFFFFTSNFFIKTIVPALFLFNRSRCDLYSPRTHRCDCFHTAPLGCEWLPPCSQSRNCWFLLQANTAPSYEDQICIMYFRLDYARRALSNFPMSHTGESVSGKLIHENPIMPARATVSELVRRHLGVRG